MRAYNFCAGPAALPTAVLEKAQAEMLDWHGKGLSIMEMSHRSADYVAMAEKAEADLRKLMNIPENYKVLFLQGGASLQFSAIPLNLLGKNNKADYIHTGIWSEKALKKRSAMAIFMSLKRVFRLKVSMPLANKANGTYLPMLPMCIMQITKQLVVCSLPIFQKQTNRWYVISHQAFYLHL